MIHQTDKNSIIFHNFIGGRQVEPTNGAYSRNINPANGEVIGEFADSGTDDTNSAISHAHEAQKAWAGMSTVARAAFVAKAAQILRERIDTIARDLTREEGKTIGEARGETLNGIAKLEFACSEALRITGETLPNADMGIQLYTLREPLGVVASISPWNFPFSTPAGKIGIALVAGNTVVMKPASLTPLSSVHFVQAFADAGLPAGVLNLVMGGGRTVGDALVTDNRVNGVTFTGSTAVGIGIAQKAAAHLCKTQLELGGKNPMVVMDDADIELAAKAAVDAAFLSCGQKCTATSRIIVHKDAKKALLSKMLERTASIRVGDGLDEQTYMGPVVDENQLNSILSYIEIGRKEGARLLVGGERLGDGDLANGFFISPAIFDDVESSMRIASEEIFGPVLSILTVGSFEEALETANTSEYGLSSSIFTRSLRHANAFARNVQAGVVKINGPTPGNAVNAPFGGRKQSGVNISLKQIDFFSELKSVYQKFN
ncbi:MAG: aldehyde dehydrogenase family protein [Nitratireductor sp.]|nr:aldehyde dehydrogenase family protein [Nitratireductor sp.]